MRPIRSAQARGERPQAEGLCSLICFPSRCTSLKALSVYIEDSCIVPAVCKHPTEAETGPVAAGDRGWL